MLTHLGVAPEIIAKGFAEFKPLPHRMQRLGTIRGVTVIDDSKATSLTATQAALKMIAPAKAHLIAGGQLKEDDLDFLDLELSKSVKKAYLIGEAAPALYEAWEDLCDCEQCGDMKTAVDHALANAVEGDILLLSPGCASFDQYDGMAKRGEHFKACVEAHAPLA
jgi:UDP-N-acetylmuramoylalanine--D-glutamate ligase